MLKGKFMYVDANEQIPEFAFVDAETHKKKRVPVSMIEQLTLAGSEKGLTTRNNSTEFVWVENLKTFTAKYVPEPLNCSITRKSSTKNTKPLTITPLSPGVKATTTN